MIFPEALPCIHALVQDRNNRDGAIAALLPKHQVPSVSGEIALHFILWRNGPPRDAPIGNFLKQREYPIEIGISLCLTMRFDGVGVDILQPLCGVA